MSWERAPRPLTFSEVGRLGIGCPGEGCRGINIQFREKLIIEWTSPLGEYDLWRMWPLTSPRSGRSWMRLRGSCSTMWCWRTVHWLYPWVRTSHPSKHPEWVSVFSLPPQSHLCHCTALSCVHFPQPLSPTAVLTPAASKREGKCQGIGNLAVSLMELTWLAFSLAQRQGDTSMFQVLSPSSGWHFLGAVSAMNCTCCHGSLFTRTRYCSCKNLFWGFRSIILFSPFPVVCWVALSHKPVLSSAGCFFVPPGLWQECLSQYAGSHLFKLKTSWKPFCETQTSWERALQSPSSSEGKEPTLSAPLSPIWKTTSCHKEMFAFPLNEAKKLPESHNYWVKLGTLCDKWCCQVLLLKNLLLFILNIHM